MVRFKCEPHHPSVLRSTQLRKVFLRVINRRRAIRHGGDDLAQRLCTNVAHGEHAGKTGLRGLVRDDVARGVQRELFTEQLRFRRAADADEDCVAGKLARLAR